MKLFPFFERCGFCGLWLERTGIGLKKNVFNCRKCVYSWFWTHSGGLTGIGRAGTSQLCIEWTRLVNLRTCVLNLYPESQRTHLQVSGMDLWIPNLVRITPDNVNDKIKSLLVYS